MSLSSAALRRWADSLDEVDVTIAERRPLDALQALRRVEKMLTRPPSPQSSDPLHKKKVLQGGSCPCGIMTCCRTLQNNTKPNEDCNRLCAQLGETATFNWLQAWWCNVESI